MNHFVWLFLGVLLFSACFDRRNEETVSQTDVIIKADTLETLADTLEPDTPEVIPPQSVDEFFDDFIYSFATNQRFQMRRIAFPLPVYGNGDSTTLSRREWQFDPLHMNEDFYVMLLNNERQIHAEKDSSLKQVFMEWFYFRESRVMQYGFHKKRNRWMLTEIKNLPLSKHPNGAFMHFYHKFASDSLFQRDHVAEYMDFSTYDEEISEQKINGVVDIEQWFAFRPPLPADSFVLINYGLPFPNPNKRVLVFCGISNSMMNVLTFHRHEKSWRLVKFEI